MKLSVLSRYLAKEVLQALVAVTLVLIAVLLTNRLVRYLADAASGNLPTDVIFHLLGLQMVVYLGMVLPAAFFLAVVLAFGRLYRDSEMAALTACGVGARELYRALYLVAVPLAVLVAALAFWLGPLAAQATARVQAQALQDVELEGVQAGRFISFRQAGRTFYAESVSEDGRRMENVFVQSERGDRMVLITARSARQQRDPETGDRYVVLKDGYRYEGVPGQASWRRLEFVEHGVLIAQQPVAVRSRVAAMPTTSLWGMSHRNAKAELQWRLSMPLSVLLLTLVAVPLSKAEPREGRYGKLLTAVLVYVLYSNGLSMSQDWMRDGAIPPAIGLWWVHLLLLCAGLYWLRRRYGAHRPRVRRSSA